MNTHKQSHFSYHTVSWQRNLVVFHCLHAVTFSLFRIWTSFIACCYRSFQSSTHRLHEQQNRAAKHDPNWPNNLGHAHQNERIFWVVEVTPKICQKQYCVLNWTEGSKNRWTSSQRDGDLKINCGYSAKKQRVDLGEGVGWLGLFITTSNFDRPTLRLF